MNTIKPNRTSEITYEKIIVPKTPTKQTSALTELLIKGKASQPLPIPSRQRSHNLSLSSAQKALTQRFVATHIGSLVSEPSVLEMNRCDSREDPGSSFSGSSILSSSSLRGSPFSGENDMSPTPHHLVIKNR